MAALLCACGPSPASLEFVPPDVVVDAIDAGYLGDPSLVVGVVEAGAFKALEPGDALPIVHGFQGGRWIHVAYRVTGVRNRGHVSLNIEGIGTSSYDIKLLRREQVLEAYDLPIPVGRDPRLTDDEIDALAGQSVRLVARFTVGEATLEVGHDLVLSLGSH